MAYLNLTETTINITIIICDLKIWEKYFLPKINNLYL